MSIALLCLWVLLTLVVVHLCSLIETTLYSVRVSALTARKSSGSAGAARLLQIKQDHIDEAVGAVLILNTLIATLGLTLAGAQSTTLFGESWVALLSAGLTVFVLVFSEIIPKTLASRYAGSFSGFVGYALSYLMLVMSPVLVGTNALIRLLARRPRERLTRREFTTLVGSAHEQGSILLAESMIIGSLIYSREVMTPASAIFRNGRRADDRRSSDRAGRRSFSRIPLIEGASGQIVGYDTHSPL